MDNLIIQKGWLILKRSILKIITIYCRCLFFYKIPIPILKQENEFNLKNKNM